MSNDEEKRRGAAPGGEEEEDDLMVEDWQHVLCSERRSFLRGPAGKGTLPVRKLNGGAVGLFFSAHGYPVPEEVLAAYAGVREAGHRFEVVYVPTDAAPAQYRAAAAAMPWPSIPHGDECVHGLLEALGVDTLPTLVLFDAEGRLITGDGIEVVAEEGVAGFPWTREEGGGVRELVVNLRHVWQGEPSLVLLLDGASPEEQESGRAALAALGDASRGLHLFVTTRGGPSAAGVRRLVGLDDSGPPAAVILNLADEGRKYVREGPLPAAGVRGFVADFAAGKLQPALVSAPAPANDEEEGEAGVGVAVASTLRRLVAAGASRVAVVSIWNAQCSAARTISRNAARALREAGAGACGVRFYSFDADSNELDRDLVRAEYLPLVKAWAGGEGSEFEGATSSAALLEWALSLAPGAFDLAAALEALGRVLQAEAGLARPALVKTYAHAVAAADGAPLTVGDAVAAVRDMAGDDEAAADLLPLVRGGRDDGDEIASADEWVACWAPLAATVGVEVDPEVVLDVLAARFTVAACARAGVCTFAESGKSMVQQPFFWCLTCSPQPGVGCCASCVAVCHKDHDVTLPPQQDEADEEEDDCCVTNTCASSCTKQAEAEAKAEDDCCATQACAADDATCAKEEKQADAAVFDCYCDCGAGDMPSPCKLAGQTL